MHLTMHCCANADSSATYSKANASATYSKANADTSATYPKANAGTGDLQDFPLDRR
jgi:hypothetical protein